MKFLLLPVVLLSLNLFAQETEAPAASEAPAETRQEKRAERKENRQERRAERKANRQDKRAERKANRQERRANRKGQ